MCRKSMMHAEQKDGELDIGSDSDCGSGQDSGDLLETMLGGNVSTLLHLSANLA